jgi:hypothetical protein
VIVRILGENQYDVDDGLRDEIERLDAVLETALQQNDATGFTAALDTIDSWVRSNGTPVDPATIVPSDLALPAQGSEIDEVRTLLESEGGAV